MEITLSERIEVAKAWTSRAANMKDWRIRNKHNREMREIARELTNGKGYVIASVKELAVKYGTLCHYETTAPDAEVKRVWAVYYNLFWKKLQFVAI